MSLQGQIEQLETKKKELAARRPMSASEAAKLKDYFDVEWTYNSNAIEGSTLSLRETDIVLHYGLTVGGKSLREHLEAINHKQAIDFVESLTRSDTSILEFHIRQIHALILKGIDDEEAGRYRRGQVRIGGSSLVPPEPIAVPGLMQQLIGWLQNEGQLEVAVVRSTLAHLRLVQIHPFVDGNGRTARLLMNLLLMREGYPPAVIRSDDRLEYYAALDQADKGTMEPFISLIAVALDRSLDAYLEVVN